MHTSGFPMKSRMFHLLTYHRYETCHLTMCIIHVHLYLFVLRKHAYYFQLQGQINMTLTDEPLDPGRMHLEPGRCVQHHLSVMNDAHLRTAIEEAPLVCIVKDGDEIVEIEQQFTTTVQAGSEAVTVSGSGEGIQPQ